METYIDNKPTIIVDTREQIPYFFSDKFNRKVLKLYAGDYSIEPYSLLISVERKSLSDFINTIQKKNRKRFENELEKLLKYPHRIIIVECTKEDIIQHKYYSRIPPSAVLNIVKELNIKWKIVVKFAGNRQESIVFIENFLMKTKMNLDRERLRLMNKKDIENDR